MGAVESIPSVGVWTVPVGPSRASAGFQAVCAELAITPSWKDLSQNSEGSPRRGTIRIDKLFLAVTPTLYHGEGAV